MHAFLICGQDQNRVEEKAENLLRLKSGEITPENRIDLRPSAKKDNKLPTLTIEDVRFISNWLSWQSRNQRAVVVHQIQCMTVPAQQAFLKTLEEPGGENRKQETENNEQKTRINDGSSSVTIILTADSETSLLPTIRSRCKIIRLSVEISTTHVDSQRYSVGILHDSTEIGNKSPSERLTILYNMLSEFSGKKFSPNQQGSIPRPDALKFMEHIIDNLHSSLIHKSSIINHKSMTSCLQSACLAHRRLKNNLNVQLALQQFILDIPPVSR